MPDIQLPEAPRKAGSSVSAAQVRSTLEDSKASALMMLLTFYADLASVREYIRNLWMDYRDGAYDLLTASVTANTALELLRRPHDDVVEHALPFFDNSPSLATCALANHLIAQFFDEDMREYFEPLPLFTVAGSMPIDFVGQVYEYLCITNLQVLNGLACVIKDGIIPVSRTAAAYLCVLVLT